VLKAVQHGPGVGGFNSWRGFACFAFRMGEGERQRLDFIRRDAAIERDALDALLVGRTAVALGAGRDKKGDSVDLSAGIVLNRKPGEAITAGDSIMELHYNDAARLDTALALATQATVISDRPPAEAPLLLGWVHDSGEQMFVAL